MLKQQLLRYAYEAERYLGRNLKRHHLSHTPKDVAGRTKNPFRFFLYSWWVTFWHFYSSSHFFGLRNTLDTKNKSLLIEQAIFLCFSLGPSVCMLTHWLPAWKKKVTWGGYIQALLLKVTCTMCTLLLTSLRSCILPICWLIFRVSFWLRLSGMGTTGPSGLEQHFLSQLAFEL